ncbi:ABC-F family ATP-binding cassette domain-containing protein [Terracidiphilus gabretensis]|uniref:ABC-F family ATP-binding cassette domain-containing protein n=1 Tax=Terracidiphilus gabretensis TaxID=1577687 RepID=UPI00071B150C|nr:ABC-F family ATP-binding cassette domain-containing protein [Terracidiphilus gabretensis]
MPPILNAQTISKAFGAAPLFRNISLTVNEGDRIGLIGPNGAGKSTLLSVLAGIQSPDSGEVATRKRARVAYVAQDSFYPGGLNVRDVLERALTEAHVAENDHEGRLRELAGRTGFIDLTAQAASLSGGWRKRLAIAEALVLSPDVLLLDEPTNHLDLAGIRWLEELLEDAGFATVIVSHDRYFLENVANEIVELNRIYPDGLLRVRGKFSRFLEERQSWLEANSREQESLRNRVRTEIEWLRRGPKARTTKSKARIDTAHGMIRKLADMDSRSTVNNAGIDFQASDRKTKRLITLEDVSCKIGGRTLFENLNFVFTAGTRVGLVGANGSGKTTLLRLLRGEIEPTSGTIQRAEFLKTVYFSQLREIDSSLTLRRALAPDGDAVIYQGRQIHVASWAARFLFTGEQLNQPVDRLSGGERARVLIARLMLEPADLLLLDEPTNDLDIPTLDILEESLLEFPGALVLVTHDRYLLDRISTTVLGLNGNGSAEQFASYSQWEDWQAESETPQSTTAPKADSATALKQESKKKLSYLEAREFATIEQRVEEADARLIAAHARVEDPTVAIDATALQQALAELEAAQHAIDTLYARWAELTEKAG